MSSNKEAVEEIKLAMKLLPEYPGTASSHLEGAIDLLKADEEPECTCIVHEKLGGSTFTNPNNCPIHAPVQSVDKLQEFQKMLIERVHAPNTPTKVFPGDLINLIDILLESKVNQ